MHILRLYSILLGAGTVYFSYRLAIQVAPGRPALGLATMAFVAFLPQFLFVSAAITNDNAMILLATLVLWLLARWLSAVPERDSPWLETLGLGLALGLAALTKLSGLALLFLTGLMLLWRAWRTQRWRSAMARLAVIGVVVAMVAGWWYVRNWRLYGDISGLAPFLAIVGPRASPLTLRALPVEFQGLRISLLALFGWFNIILPNWVYRLWDLFLAVAIAGLGWGAWRAWRGSDRKIAFLWRHRGISVSPGLASVLLVGALALDSVDARHSGSPAASCHCRDRLADNAGLGLVVAAGSSSAVSPRLAGCPAGRPTRALDTIPAFCPAASLSTPFFGHLGTDTRVRSHRSNYHRWPHSSARPRSHAPYAATR